MKALHHGLEFMLSIKPGTSASTIQFALNRVKNELGYNYLTYQPHTRFISVINQKRSDSRLLKSNYYQIHKHQWFEPTSIGSGFTKYISDKNVDLELTFEEMRVVEVLMDTLRECIDSYGWFDVAFVL